MKSPTALSIFHYACFTLGLRSFFSQPGDGRIRPHIPAVCLTWALLIGTILRLKSASRLAWLVQAADRRQLGLTAAFADDALAYFTERLDPEIVRRRAAATLKLAKYNKVFQESAFIGFAIDGTGAGRTVREPCPFCHPLKDSHEHVIAHTHQFVMISIVGVGITLPFDIEPYKPGDSEYSAGQRLLRRTVGHLGLHFADYAVVDAKFSTAPFLRVADEVDVPTIGRLKDNLPELKKAVDARFGHQPPQQSFWDGADRVEVWDADDFDPWSTLDWPTVRVLRYRQYKPNGTIIQADWLTDFSIARLGSRSFFKLAKSRWEIENQGFNDAKNRYGMEHIQHHHPNSMLVNWLLLLLALIIERLYRIRYLHRGTHPILPAQRLADLLLLNLGPAHPNTS